MDRAVKGRQLALVAAPTEPRDGAADDAEAFGRVSAGDLGALGEVFDRHSRPLLRFVQRATGGRDAEDIVQTTFVRAMALASTFDPRAETARPWLFGIASRVVLEQRRALARFTRALGRLRPSSLPTSMIQTEASDVERALGSLSPTKRLVLVLAEIEGYRCEEIATMLDVPIGTVWTRLHHARKEARAWLEERS